MKILNITLGFIYAALIALLFLSRCEKPAPDREDDDEDDIEQIDENDEEDDIEQANEYGTGDLQVTLLWDFPGDLDLHVIEPDGYDIGYVGNVEGEGGGENYNAKAPDSSPNGGQLDHDDIDGGRESAENIYWANNPPRGTYKVYVVFFGHKDGSPRRATARVLVRQTGRQPQTYRVEVTDPNPDNRDDYNTDMAERTFVTDIQVR